MAQETQKPELTAKEKAEADFKKRKELGKAGRLWRVAVYYYVGGESKCHYMDNQTAAEVREIRADLFVIGLMVPVEPGHWVVIPPADLGQVHIYKQKRFFE